MNDEQLRVLLVEDSRSDAMVALALLAEAGRRSGVHFDVEHVTGYHDAMRRLDAGAPAFDAVLLDLGLPDADGVSMVPEFSRRHPHVAVVVKTASEDDYTAVASVVGGAQEYLRKGTVKPDELARVLRHAVLRVQLEHTRRESEAEHRALFEHNPYPIWIVDADTLAIFAVNEAAGRFSGWAGQQAVGMPLQALFPDERTEELHAVVALAADEEDSRAWHLRTRDARELRVCISAHALTYQHRPARMVIARDVTESLRALEALRNSERRFREMFELSPGLLCEHDLDGRLLAINPAAAHALGYEPADLIGVRLHALVPEPFAASVEIYLAQIRATGEFEGVMTIATRDQRWRALRFQNRLYAEAGRQAFVVGQAQDVTDALRREEALRDASLTDPLTGARNRRFLAQHALHAKRWSCIVVDLDGFKAVNDRDGHRRGDEVLVEVVAFLQAHARRDDIVVRLGGDEFMLLLQEQATDETYDTAQALQAAVRDGAPIGMSIGWAVREGSESMDDTIARADAMLYSDRGRRRQTPLPVRAR